MTASSPAPSPTQAAGALASFTITANGAVIDSAWQVFSIDVWTGVNKLPKARLVLYDGSAAAEDFPISDSNALIPGATLTIALGYDGNDTTVFSGIVYRQGLEVTQNGPSRLVVEATDKAMAMTLARRNAIFENQTDSQIITQLIKAAGLTAAVTSTATVQESIVQYYCTDWDLMLVRAQVDGMVVISDGGTVTVQPPDTSQSAVLTVTFGDSLMDFQVDMDASTQYASSAIQSVAWDPATQALAKSGQASAAVTEPGNISSADLAKVFNVSPFTQQTGGSVASADLTSWSSADLLKSRLAKIRGTATFQGSALARAGGVITLAGVGGRFNGNYYVSSLHHGLQEGNWRTTAGLGLSPDWFTTVAPNIPAPGAAGLLPPVANLQTGIVKKVDQDPDGEFRVYVQLPLLQASGTLGVWARLGSFYACKSIGAEFYPEIGAEVVVAFMNDDPRYPVIIGGLYSKANPPPVTPDAQNNQKCIVTRAKLRIDFHEDTPAVQVSTPGGQSVRLDDDKKTVTLTDMNGNTVTMAPGGVTVDSAADITLSAKGNISVTAKGNLSMQADANVTVKGLQVSHTASSTFSAQGSGQAKLTSSGILTIQGALVKIN